MLYQISHGAVAFADDVILHDINFEIRNTEKIAVVGRNGCGKTTLLKLINGEVDLDKGESDTDVFIAKAGNPQIGYLRQIAFDDPAITLEQEVRKVFAPMEQRKRELEAAAAALETDYSEEQVARYTAMEEKFKEDGGYYFEKEYDVLIRKFGFSEEERRKPLRRTADEDCFHQASVKQAGYPASRRADQPPGYHNDRMARELSQELSEGCRCCIS